MGGRGVPPEVVNELQEGYAQIGFGDEPSRRRVPSYSLDLTSTFWTNASREVYLGGRNWEHFIGNVVENMKRDGITRAKAICLPPGNSGMSVGRYKRAIENAAGDSMEATLFLHGQITLCWWRSEAGFLPTLPGKPACLSPTQPGKESETFSACCSPMRSDTSWCRGLTRSSLCVRPVSAAVRRTFSPP
jgi:hypothetical protein